MSALDPESEAEVLCALEDLRKHMGIIIVSHRLAAVRVADSICVLEAGQVVESGSWSELMARRSHLYSMVEAQQLLSVNSRPVLAGA
jgi:ABC-type multidrug transport system fused ATPase/permease subunit